MEGFVDVFGAVEPDALAAAIAMEAHQRSAEALVVAMNELDDEDRGLNELQKVRLVEMASKCLDGFEASVRAELKTEFDRIRVRVADDA